MNYIDHNDTGETWEQLLLAADSDFVAFILLSHCGISESTSLWMSIHSIEKYLKSYLLKSDHTANVKEYGHKIEKLWNVLKPNLSEQLDSDIDVFNQFISEIDMDEKNIHIRYKYGITLKDPVFTKTYASICTMLRILILGREAYDSRGLYGLCDASFGGTTPFFEETNIPVKKIISDEMTRLLS